MNLPQITAIFGCWRSTAPQKKTPRLPLVASGAVQQNLAGQPRNYNHPTATQHERIVAPSVHIPARHVGDVAIKGAALRPLAVTLVFSAIGIAVLRGDLQRFLLCNRRKLSYSQILQALHKLLHFMGGRHWKTVCP